MPQSSSAQSVSHRLWAGVTIGVTTVVVIGIWGWLRCAPSAPVLPVEGGVPPFTLIERNGRAVSRDDLRGRIWVADFIFTRCASLCPALSASMARVQSALREAGDSGTRLVSFSVDPEADTPSVLQEYARRFQADDTQWLFLTGDRAVLYELIGAGFRLPVAQREEAGTLDPNELITHSNRFVLVDWALQIRGWYQGTDDDEMAQMLRDIERLRMER